MDPLKLVEQNDSLGTKLREKDEVTIQYLVKSPLKWGTILLGTFMAYQITKDLGLPLWEQIASSAISFSLLREVLIKTPQILYNNIIDYSLFTKNSIDGKATHRLETDLVEPIMFVPSKDGANLLEYKFSAMIQIPNEGNWLDLSGLLSSREVTAQDIQYLKGFREDIFERQFKVSKVILNPFSNKKTVSIILTEE